MSVQILDLSSFDGYKAAVEWLRMRVLLKPRTGFLELDLEAASGQRVSLFRDARDAYIVAFRGRDKTYVLDDSSRDYQSELVGSGLVAAGDTQTLTGLTVSHRSLGTLAETFWRADLGAAAHILSSFSASSGVSGQLGRYLSLLVCLLAECARSYSMEFEFGRLYWDQGKPVQADEAIQSYDQAVRITRMADRLFSGTFPQLHRILKLEKRAAETAELITVLNEEFSHSNQKQMLNQVVSGTLEPAGKYAKDAATRLQSIAQELRMSKGEELGDMVTTCKNETAMRAARSGVVIPPIV